MTLREIHQVGRRHESIGAQTREWMVTTQNCPSLREHGFTLAGWSRAREGFCFIRPDPPFSQVLACFAGYGEVLVEGRWQRCEAGQAYVTPPHVRHAYRAIPGEVWRIAWVHDYAGTVRAAAPRVVSADTEAYYYVIHGLYRESVAVAERDVLESWLFLLDAHTRRIARAGEALRLEGLWEAVTADLAHPWTLAEMAAHVGVSAEHLRRLSQAETGRSPLRQVTRLRMRHAETLLASGRYSVGQVAERVGYENAFAFATAYRRVTGHPPSASRPGGSTAGS